MRCMWWRTVCTRPDLRVAAEARGDQAGEAGRQGLTLVHFRLNLSCLCAPRNPT